jgi:hypothetical protein
MEGRQIGIEDLWTSQLGYGMLYGRLKVVMKHLDRYICKLWTYILRLLHAGTSWDLPEPHTYLRT